MANLKNIEKGQILYEVSISSLGNYSVTEIKVINKYEDGNELANYVADQLALDLLEFKSCMKDKNSIEESLNDISDADNLGAFVVPFMKVNNIELLGNISDGDLDRAVESEMAK